MKQGIGTFVGQAVVAASLVGLLGLSPAVLAASQTFISDPNVTSVGGKATFTPGTDQITLQLWNTKIDIASLAETLSDISFSVSNGGDVTTSSVTSSANGGLITLVDGSAASTSTGTSNPWSLSGGSGSYLFTGLNGGDQTKTLIIGPLSNPATFCTPSKCPDGLGNQNFNPFLNQTATFVLGISGVTADSIISNVVFSFGTQPETLVGVPIPAAVWLFASGLLGLIGIARRKHQALAAA